MRKMSQMMGALTAIEYLEKRYPSPAIRLVAGTLTVFLLGFYVLAQLIAGGKGMALVTGISYPIALAIAVGIILIYTFMGGYLAVAYTDFFQSLVMLVGVMWIVIAALSELGGLTAANNALGDLDPTLLSVWGRGMGWPHVVTRHMAMSRPATARKAGFWATIWSLFFVPAPYLVGILAVLILPGLDDPEMAIFQVAAQLLPAAVTGLVMAAIMAAIMSTADSLLLQTGSIASRDIYERFINPKASERQMVMVSRGLVVAVAVIGYVVALVEPPTVFSIVIFATSVLGSAFLPAYVCAVWWRKANTPGALASMIVGATVAFVWEYAGLVNTTQLHPMLTGVVSSTITMIVVSLATQKIAPVPAHILDAMNVASQVGPIPERFFAATDFDLANEAAAVSKAIEEGGQDG
jgi:sodium/proline symporter